jgi:hypothetical protein
MDKYELPAVGSKWVFTGTTGVYTVLDVYYYSSDVIVDLDDQSSYELSYFYLVFLPCVDIEKELDKL